MCRSMTTTALVISKVLDRTLTWDPTARGEVMIEPMSATVGLA